MSERGSALMSLGIELRVRCVRVSVPGAEGAGWRQVPGTLDLKQVPDRAGASSVLRNERRRVSGRRFVADVDRAGRMPAIVRAPFRRGGRPDRIRHAYPRALV